MLKPAEDAYGRLMLDHSKGLPTAEIVERDDGFVAVSGGAEVYLSPFEKWVPFQRQLLRACRGRALDVGCGAGRASLALQDRGHSTVAIDLSPLAVRVARRRGVRDARVMSVVQVSRTLGEFDSILMLGNNLGLLGGLARGRWLLKRWRALTGPGARIVAETVDPHDTENPHHRAYAAWNRKRGRLPGQLRIRVRYAGYRTPWFDYLLVSRPELRKLVRGTGWEIARLIDGPGPRYGVVLEKSS